MTEAPTTVDEGDIAADYIEELLDICDLGGDIDIDVTDGRTTISVESESPAELAVLATPDAVAALQELTRLVVQARTGEYSRLVLDIGGSREARRRELSLLVDDAISRLDAGEARVDFDPMTSYERKIVHDLIAERGLTSESEGESRDRHIVLTR
ncbi:R3H domain-containing nucleic acid-binding protein [Herbiconiux sp. L3-i23]|uniref:Jag family protein n=1 Tax=Herbiconiux sp. L3-i23 TaxID=2905871 RepID=UPI00204A2AA9|nr:R3H domain-containing nucleic acid-binding protein [Herbiconiux sp. L3-i23]BDI24205.1 single-stranded DNA-binding protein [Herbiconiux sp. L3-i23]